MFSLLERKDVQGELKMAPEQVAGIARACHASDQDIPDLLVGLTPEQLAQWHKIQGKPFPIAWPPTSVSDSPFDK